MFWESRYPFVSFSRCSEVPHSRAAKSRTASRNAFCSSVNRSSDGRAAVAVALVIGSGLHGRVDGDDGRAAQPDVVLERDLRAIDLPLVRLAAELPGELGALGEAGGAEWVALRD